ncbi:MAG: VOC family protein [Acidobacteria bacterium]|nr:VOC family protein [Acidobacteriota bacterium]
MEIAACPVLPSRDLDTTIRFYGALGFTLVYEQEAPDPYAIVELHGVELHFFGRPDLDPATSIAGCYLRVGDVGRVERAWSKLGLPAAGIPRLEPAADRPWGMRELALVDPDGNLVRVGEILE